MSYSDNTLAVGNLRARFALALSLAGLVVLAAAAAVQADSTARSNIRLAVLYFDNNTSDADFDLLRKGMADMLITDLAQVNGIDVVERDKLEALVKERQLQRSSYFDRKTALRMGRMLGATHAVAGSFNRVRRDLRIDVRLIDMSTGKVVAAEKVRGDKGQFFALQQQLAGGFACALVGDQCRAAHERGRDRTALGTLMEYSRGLEQADAGDLEQASRTLRAVVERAPSFTPAKATYRKIMKRLYAAKENRKGVLASAEAALMRKIDRVLGGGNPAAKNLSDDAFGRIVGYRVLRGQLYLRRIEALFRDLADRGQKRLSQADIGRFRQLVSDYQRNQLALLARLDRFENNYPGRDLPDCVIDEEDAKHGENLGLGDEPGKLSFYSPQQIRRDLGAFLATGVAPFWGTFRFSGDIALYKKWHVDSRVRINGTVKYVTVARPPVHLLRQHVADDAVRLFQAALSDIARRVSDAEERQRETIETLDMYAMALAALDRHEEAIAKWQTILDRYPRYEEYHLIEGKIKKALGL